jgi:protoheme IX farnesyltransferase
MRFFSVVKPGIIFGNIVTVTGGFFLASHQHFNFWLFLATIVGMSLVIACGCVFNNYIDRDIDSVMQRTKGRVMVQGLISGKIAILYGVVLGFLGFLVLLEFTNLLTTMVAFTGLFIYVVAYTVITKRNTTFGTLVGGVAGAVPPVVGYCAVTNTFDAGAIIVFMILLLWQMPHFYAISIYRLEDFSAACIPVLPIVKNIRYTKISMIIYIILFIIASVMPTVFGFTGYIYLFIALLLGIFWLNIAVKGLKVEDDRKWARKVFGFSILAITILSLAMIIKI